ncbi:MAG: peptidylprolyl isomerase [Erysipelotrichaceae bacterium]|nr:peptidylprolyl isomerase [Erysipelotrichaceae bacterium]
MNFKKITLPFLVSGIILTGCQSSGSIPKVDNQDVVASLTDYNILADDIFNNIKNTTNGKNAYYAVVIKAIVDKYFPITDDMKNDAKITRESIESSYESSYGESAEDYLNQALAYYGYESMDEYEESLISQYQYIAFLQSYIDSNFDAVLADYISVTNPRTANVISVTVENADSLTDDEKAIIDAIDAKIAAGDDFATIAAEYSSDSTASASGSLGVVDSNSDLDTTYGDGATDEVLGLKAGATSSWLANSTVVSIFKCDSTDSETIRTEVQDLGIDSPLLTYDSYMEYLAFNTYEITYKDDDTKSIIQELVADALETRAQERGDN